MRKHVIVWKHLVVEVAKQRLSTAGFAQQLLDRGPTPRNGRKSDQAHPPIHPTKSANNLQVRLFSTGLCPETSLGGRPLNLRENGGVRHKC